MSKQQPKENGSRSLGKTIRTLPKKFQHKAIPIVGEFGRYTVDSRSAMKLGREEAYIVDVLEVEDTNVGRVAGTCPCKGWRIRKDCTHLQAARIEHQKAVASQLGFDDLDTVSR